MGWTTGFDSRQWKKIYLFPAVTRTAQGGFRTPYAMSSGEFFPEMKRPGLDADYSAPPYTEVKNS
jgi:hypothetical protein